MPFSTEEGTYLSCSVAAAYAGVRAYIASKGMSGCVAANGTVTAARATSAVTGGALTQIPYQAVYANYGTNDTYSVFADGTWIPTPRLEITAGARLLIERRKSGYSATQPNSVLLASLGVKSSLLGLVDTGGRQFTAQRSFSAVLPRFNVLYRVTDAINLYATLSKGRRSPVVQLSAAASAAGAVAALQVVPDEVVWNYEGGIKGKIGPFSGSLGVFYQAYNGFQVSVINSSGVTTTQSAGKASNPGAEFEGNLRLGRILSLFGTFAYVDGKIDNNASYGVYSGAQFRLQPKYTASGGATLRVPSGNLTFYATPSATYQSKEYFELPNTAAISQGGYTLVNVRAGVELAAGKYSIGSFARNALDRKYLIDAGNTGATFGTATYIRGEPRTYGVEISGKF